MKCDSQISLRLHLYRHIACPPGLGQRDQHCHLPVEVIAEVHCVIAEVHLYPKCSHAES